MFILNEMHFYGWNTRWWWRDNKILDITDKENIFILPTYMIMKHLNMYQEARLNNYTYKSSIFCNIGIKYVLVDQNKTAY